jgi:hypothetical protein
MAWVDGPDRTFIEKYMRRKICLNTIKLLAIMATSKVVWRLILWRKLKFKKFLYLIVLTIKRERMTTRIARRKLGNFVSTGWGCRKTIAARSKEAEGIVNPA